MKKIFSLFAALTLSVGLWAVDNVAYIDANGQLQHRDGVTEITNSSATLAAGWYVVKGTDVQTGALTCQGAVHIILADGAKLTATTDYWGPAGINVTGTNSLTIYAQSTGEQMGQLIATGGANSAGIGGNCDQDGSNITINGGKVTANSGDSGGAAIGGGYGGVGSNITINGGKVTATASGYHTTAIGSGKSQDSNLPDPTASNIFVATTLQVKADGNNPPTTVIENTGSDLASSLLHKFYVVIEPKPLPVSTTYLDENGEEQNIDAWEVKDASAAVTWGTAGDTTWFVVKGTNVQLAKGAICNGDVRLILADGAKLTATGDNWATGIEVSGLSNSLTIYGQTAQSGQLIATGGEYGGAGIGGGDGTTGRNITINGGIITATGRGEAAGIGGGKKANAVNIVINGGSVTAIGGDNAAGIGSGEDASASDIYISDAYILKAGAEADPTTVIAHSSATDMGSLLNDNAKKYVKIEGLATPYTRTVTANSWGTVCLPYDATSFEGADFYKVNYYDASNPSDLKLYIEPVDNLVAGMPYIFQATAETVIINHNATAPEAVTADYEGSGLYGSFARKTIAYDAEHKYAAIAGGAVVIVGEGNTVTVPACRAYLDMNEVATSVQPHKAPLRAMGVPRQQPTNNENVNADGNMNGKFVINGQFVIVKDGKKINALGF